MASGCRRSPADIQTTGSTVMAILRRTSREVYRVYSEAEYLAGADEFGEWHTLRSRRAPHEHPLRRLGAAGALTAALGALGGLIVFAGIGVRSPNRRVAVNRTPVKGGVLLRPGEVEGVAYEDRDRARRTARMRHGRVAERRGAGRSRPRAGSASSRRAAGKARGVSAEPVVVMPAVAYDATRVDPGGGAPRSPTQSEFGFER